MSAPRPWPLPPTRSERTLWAAGTILAVGAALQLAGLAWFYLRGGATARRTAGFLPSAARVDGVVSPAFRAAPLPNPSAGSPESALPGPAAARARVPADPGPMTLPAALPTPVAPLAAAAIPERGFRSSLPPTATATASATAGPGPEGDRLPPGALAQPTPAGGAAARRPGLPGDALEQARALRSRGDLQTALARLRDALQAAPGNPELTAELALTYETLQMPAQAAEQWQRLVGQGEGAGAPYHLAAARLRGAESGSGSGGSAGPDPGAGPGGFRPGARLRIAETQVEEQNDENFSKRLVLRTSVQARPGASVDPRQVKVEAYFYDRVGEREITLTDANTSYRWLTPPIDWADGADEVLETAYERLSLGPNDAAAASPLLPPPGPTAGSRRGRNRTAAPPPPLPSSPPPPPAAGSPAGPPPRVYAGYIVRIYYQGQLQDVRADPSTLLERFPVAAAPSTDP